MHIPKNYLKSSKRIMKNDVLSIWSKLGENSIVIKAKEDVLNIKCATPVLDMKECVEKDIFKEHLMLYIW
ncbi:hypothetical protein [Clostridium thailandense]|uniref:hypothetical protein n=1 Tax=Clostridium thailandense TaxID=2794346 RepID=UPI00398948B1